MEYAITSSTGTVLSIFYQLELLLALAPRPNFVVLMTATSGASSPPTAPIRPPSSHPMADSIWKPMFDPSSLGAALTIWGISNSAPAIPERRVVPRPQPRRRVAVSCQPYF